MRDGLWNTGWGSYTRYVPRSLSRSNYGGSSSRSLSRGRRTRRSTPSNISGLLSRGSTPRGTVPGYARSATTATRGLTKRVNFRIPAMKGLKRKGFDKKCKGIDKKPKINAKFRANVQKCLAYNDPWAKYVSTHNIQLRQTNKDAYASVFEDERGHPLNENNGVQVLHHVSTLFRGKADTDDYTTYTGNFTDQIKISQLSYRTDYFFKSTSNHVVNIEMYICTAKVANSETPETLISQSYSGTYNDLLSFVGTGQAIFTQTMQVSDLGATSSEWVELYKYYDVKCHKFKLQPGDYSTYSIVQRKNKTLDLSSNEATGNLESISKGCKVVFFRAINDISVSVGEAAKIHAYPSSSQGGVAVRFTRTAMYRPLPMTDTTQTTTNVIRRSQWEWADSLGDQQVLFQNPITTATIGP